MRNPQVIITKEKPQVAMETWKARLATVGADQLFNKARTHIIPLSISPNVTIIEEPYDRNVSHIYQCTYKSSRLPPFKQILSTPTAPITSPAHARGIEAQ
jgi:hypothetical protein